MPARLNIDDLSPAARAKFGVKKPRQSQFSKDAARSNALRVLAVLANLTQDQRRRVLELAVKINDV